MNDDMIVRVRAEILSENLRGIHAMLAPRAEASAADKVFEIDAELTQRLRSVRDALIKIAGSSGDLATDARSGLDDALAQTLDTLRVTADGALNDVKRVLSDVEGYRPDLDVVRDAGLFQLTDSRNDIKMKIRTGARELSKAITADSYFASRGTAHGLMREFAELLLGAAVRSPRFGHDDAMSSLFRIADALPRLWPQPNNWQWSALALPSVDEMDEASPASILRLAYPEWSVWALPLLHGQFSRVYVNQLAILERDPMLEFTAQPGCFDALATAFAGPAYVFAALLFRIDPAAVTTRASSSREAPADAAVRSASVLRTLRLLANTPQTEQTGLAALCDRLVHAWRTAVLAADGEVDAFDRLYDDPTADTAVRQAWAIAVDQPSGTASPRVPVWAIQWETVTAWAAELRAARTPDLEAFGEGSPLEAIPPLMNAMWLARIDIDPDDSIAADGIAAIGKLATEALLTIVPSPARNIRPTLRSPGNRR